MYCSKFELYKPLRDIVFETIREMVLKGGLKPGMRLMEVELSKRVNVSRTPIREAIRKLERDLSLSMAEGGPMFLIFPLKT